MTRFITAALLASSITLVGCTQLFSDEPTWSEANENPLITANHKAADQLVQQAGSSITSNQTLIMATVVNIDKLEQSSTLGRLISEQVSGRLVQLGYTLAEIKLRQSLYIKQNQGELMLTREIKDLAQIHNAQAVIVGTYAKSNDFVFVNLKVIQPMTNMVLSSHDYSIPLTTNNRSMLGLSK